MKKVTNKILLGIVLFIVLLNIINMVLIGVLYHKGKIKFRDEPYEDIQTEQIYFPIDEETIEIIDVEE